MSTKPSKLSVFNEKSPKCTFCAWKPFRYTYDGEFIPVDVQAHGNIIVRKQWCSKTDTPCRFNTCPRQDKVLKEL